jgi:hypothetical protein
MDSPADTIDEIEMGAAILASLTSPAVAAAELRRIADEIEGLRPQMN